MRIDVDEISWGVAGRTIVRGVRFGIESGHTVGLIGPNGSGKSSLLRCVAGLRRPASGAVRFDGRAIAGWGTRELARHVAFVEQAADTDTDLRVSDVVALGRSPFRAAWRAAGGADHAIVEAALERLELTGIRSRHWHTLSGGERQRVQIARALAQRPWAILLDEPTNHLDIRHQLELMDMLAGTEQTVLVALHDLSLAARFCDRLVLVHQGELVAAGPPEEVLTAERLRDVFEVDAEIGHDSSGNVAVVYRGSSRRTLASGRPAAG